MIDLRVILGRSALLAGARVLSKVATLAVVLSVARRLPVEDFGLLGTMLAYGTFAGLLSDFGQLLPMLRGMSQGSGREAHLFGETIWPRIVWGIIGGAGLLLGGWFLGYPLLPLGLFVAASIAESGFTALVRSHEVRQAMRLVTSFIVLERVSYAVWVLSAIMIIPSVTVIAAASLGSIVLMLLLAAWTFRRHYGWTLPRFDWELVRTGTVRGLPLLAAGLLSTVYYRLDIVLLEQLASSSDAAFYNASMRVVEALMFIPMSMMATVFPMLASMFEVDHGAFRSAFRRAGALLGFTGALVAIALVLSADALVVLLYGDAFARSGAILRILGPMVFFYFLNFLASQALVAMGRDRTMTVVTAIAAMVATGLNVTFIPVYGAATSAWVRVGVEGLMALSFVWVIAQTLRQRAK
jgi:O-antigen/teichoic acid export membrane protein